MDLSSDQSHEYPAETMDTGKPVHDPHRSRVIRWVIRGLGLLFVLVIFWLGYEYYEFKVALPEIRVNYLIQQDEEVEKIPLADRGWPLYRDAVIDLDLFSFLKELRNDKIDIGEVLSIGTTHADWSVVDKYLQDHQQSLDLFLAATQKPHKGFLSHYSDPEYINFFKVAMSPGGQIPKFSETEPFEKHASRHRQPLRSVTTLVFLAAFLQAEAAADHRQLTRLLLSWLDMGLQKSETGEPNISVGLDISSLAIGPFLHVMTEHPQLFTDQELTTLKQKFLAAKKVKLYRYSLKQHRIDFQDRLQRIFAGSDPDNGFLCETSFRRLGGFAMNEFQFLKDRRAKAYRWLLEPSSNSMLHEVRQDLVALGLSRHSATQADVREKMNHLLDLVEQDRDNSQTPVRSLQYALARNEIQGNSELHHQYWVVLKLFNESDSETELDRLKQRFRHVRFSTAITAIALEQYHRQHQSWPTVLEDLVPEFLAEVPVDTFVRDGSRKMLYQIKEGQPMIYSVGLNQSDEKGWLFHHMPKVARFTDPVKEKSVPDESLFLFRYNQGDICLFPYHFDLYQPAP